MANCSYLDRPSSSLSIPVNTHMEVRTFAAGVQLTTKTLLPDDVLLSGWLGLGRPDCKGQNLIGVLLPGDRIGTVLDIRLCSVVTLTSVSVISGESSEEGIDQGHHLVRQCVRTCHFSALDRIEDFFLETYRRLEAVGLASNWTFGCPLSQAVLGNLLGLSTAHVNRTLKQLQIEGRVLIDGQGITLLRDIDASLSATNTSVMRRPGALTSAVSPETVSEVAA